MEAKHVINISGTVCPPGADGFLNKWYDEKHIPANMKFKELIGVTRYKIVRPTRSTPVKEYPQYLAMYRFKDLSTFEAWNASPELAAGSEDFPEVLTKIGAEVLWRVQYESIKTWRNTPQGLQSQLC